LHDAALKDKNLKADETRFYISEVIHPLMISGEAAQVAG